jgi:hypothetical protein
LQTKNNETELAMSDSQISFKLQFSSEITRSKYPIHLNGRELVYKKVRKTTVRCAEYKSNGELNKVRTASVVCHPKEQDIPVLGQKYAVAALTKQFADKKLRQAIWKTFAVQSKASRRIMGNLAN